MFKMFRMVKVFKLHTIYAMVLFIQRNAQNVQEKMPFPTFGNHQSIRQSLCLGYPHKKKNAFKKKQVKKKRKK